MLPSLAGLSERKNRIGPRSARGLVSKNQLFILQISVKGMATLSLAACVMEQKCPIG